MIKTILKISIMTNTYTKSYYLDTNKEFGYIVSRTPMFDKAAKRNPRLGGGVRVGQPHALLWPCAPAPLSGALAHRATVMKGIRLLLLALLAITAVGSTFATSPNVGPTVSRGSIFSDLVTSGNCTFYDNFESYTSGNLVGQGGWESCNCSSGLCSRSPTCSKEPSYRLCPIRVRPAAKGTGLCVDGFTRTSCDWGAVVHPVPNGTFDVQQRRVTFGFTAYANAISHNSGAYLGWPGMGFPGYSSHGAWPHGAGWFYGQYDWPDCFIFDIRALAWDADIHKGNGYNKHAKSDYVCGVESTKIHLAVVIENGKVWGEYTMNNVTSATSSHTVPMERIKRISAVMIYADNRPGYPRHGIQVDDITMCANTKQIISTPTASPTKAITNSVCPSPFNVTSPRRADGPFTVGDTIRIRYSAKKCTSQFVDYNMCAYVSGGSLQCNDHKSGVISAASHNLNNGSYSLKILKNPPSGAGYYVIRVSDDVCNDLVASSEHFELYVAPTTAPTIAPTSAPTIALTKDHGARLAVSPAALSLISGGGAIVVLMMFKSFARNQEAGDQAFSIRSFFLVETLDVIFDWAGLLLTWWADDLVFVNDDHEIVVRLLLASVILSTSMIIVEAAMFWSCRARFKENLGTFRGLHFGFEDTFQIIIYAFVAEAEANASTLSKSTPIVFALVQATASVLMKVAECFYSRHGSQQKQPPYEATIVYDVSVIDGLVP